MRKLLLAYLITASTSVMAQEQFPEPLVCMHPFSGNYLLSGSFPNPKSPIHLPDGEFYNGRRVFPNGYNEIADKNDKLVLHGYFVNGILSNGYHYFYDKSGNLLLADIYKGGNYICSCSDCESHIEKPVEIVPRGPQFRSGSCFGADKIYLEPLFAE